MNIIGEVPRLDWVTVERFRERFFEREAVVLTRFAPSWRALRWTIETLLERFANAWMPVSMDDDEYAAWRITTANSLAPYRRVTFENRIFRVIEMDRYFNAVLNNEEVRSRLPYVLDVPLASELVTRYLSILGIESHYDWSPLYAALESLASDVDFPPLLEGVRDLRFWFTPRPRSLGTIHADGYHNLNAQIRGHKRWIIQSPDQYRSGDALTCLTGPGDMLYIPREFWHAAEASDLSINVNAWHHIS